MYARFFSLIICQSRYSGSITNERLINVTQCYPIRSGISQYTGVMTGISGGRQKLFEIVFIQQIAAPHENSKSVRCAEAESGIEQRITINVKVLRRRRAGGERGTVVGIECQENLSILTDSLQCT